MIREGRVSSALHDTELRKPNGRRHIFMDIGEDSDNQGEIWVEVWNMETDRPDYSNDNVRWKRPPTIKGVLRGIRGVIRKNIPKRDLDEWLERMRPVQKTRTR